MRPTIDSVNHRVDGLEVRLDRVENRIIELDAKIDERFNTLDAKIDERFGTLDAKIDERFNTLDAKIDERFGTLVRHIDLKTEALLSEFRVCFEELRSHSSRIARLEAVADSHALRLETLEKKPRRRKPEI